MIGDFRDEYRRYRRIREQVLAQIPDEGLNRPPVPQGDSAAMLVRHLSPRGASEAFNAAPDGEKGPP